MRHHVDLGVDRVGAPDHHHVGLGHLARIGAGQLAGAGDVACPRRRRADGGVHHRVALGMAQPVDAIAHDEAHGAGVVVGPDRFRAIAPLGGQHGLGRDVECVVPGDALELAGALRALAAQRVHQSVGMMDALGIARDLGADDAGRVGVVLGAVNAPDLVVAQQLHVERAGRRAIVRTDRMAYSDLGVSVHAASGARGRCSTLDEISANAKERGVAVMSQGFEPATPQGALRVGIARQPVQSPNGLCR